MAGPPPGVADMPPSRPQRRPMLIVGFLGVCVLLAIGAMAGLSVYYRDPQAAAPRPIPESAWKAFIPPDGGCSLLMPGNPRVMPIGDRGTRYWLLLPEQGFEFVLFCGTPSTRLGPDDVRREMTTEQEKILRILPQAHLSRYQPITVRGFPGLETAIEAPGGQASILRGVLVHQGPHKRLYLLMVGGMGIRSSPGAATRFLESFQLEPAPAAASKPSGSD
jgi:hypothetical protein